ncbi:hypothetical protein GUITHDRAFT_117860 [Guillardia theta CCMP2712]|uniref:Uncharacterized protein n=1 Tax=Guillardia theta (strain CCMP2712) TaxID=905079 RepID=L1IJF7_GUITC|nr:hypothetical protein GUITHDRAFT_117860 [Guillardia theta CCMP2712]EKX35945.1 hypothetical protein GUITHDRAFT_117860 [Guillardia theta CCMP2712]|eukprot:XP_005822925.1 hypothetical protein GUITHDRAFT_117860 [Guillardia theta CCMP2712]
MESFNSSGMAGGSNVSYKATLAPFWYFAPSCQHKTYAVEGFTEMLAQSAVRYRYCSNPYHTWEALLYNASMGRVAFKTGGLGMLAIHGLYEVWVCIQNHPCALDPADPSFCWVYNEMETTWIPWGENSNLQLFVPSKPCGSSSPRGSFNEPSPSASDQQLQVSLSSCRMEIAMRVEDAFDLYVDGVYVTSGSDSQVVHELSVPVASSAGALVAVKAINVAGSGGLVGIFGGEPTSSSGWKCQKFPSDAPPAEWNQRSFDDSAWPQAASDAGTSMDYARVWAKGYMDRASTVFCRSLVKNPSLVCYVL